MNQEIIPRGKSEREIDLELSEQNMKNDQRKAERKSRISAKSKLRQIRKENQRIKCNITSIRKRLLDVRVKMRSIHRSQKKIKSKEDHSRKSNNSVRK